MQSKLPSCSQWSIIQNPSNFLRTSEQFARDELNTIEARQTLQREDLVSNVP